MSAAKDSDTLSKIRHEYRAKKKQLEKYNTFIDRHQGVVVGLPLFIVVIGIVVVMVAIEQPDGGTTARIAGALSIFLFLAALVMAFITGSRKSAKAKIEKQLAALKDEAVVFQKYAKDHSDITRDELGLWRDIEQTNNANSHHKAIGISIIVTVLAVLTAPLAISYFTNSNDTKNQAVLQQDSQMQASQAQCLNNAYTSYETVWKAADKDGNGGVSYKDGATDITTSYFDSVIACYRTHKTADSDSYIAEYQTKRQQEVDKYTAWLESLKQPTYIQTPSNSYSSGMNCTSNSIGSSTYTRCY